VTVRDGQVTVDGKLNLPPFDGTMALRAAHELKIHRAGKPSSKQRTGAATRLSAPGLSTVGQTTVTSRTGLKFTIHAKLRRGYRWLLQLEYINKIERPTFSRYVGVNVR
jgi:hypothetical protein